MLELDVLRVRSPTVREGSQSDYWHRMMFTLSERTIMFNMYQKVTRTLIASAFLCAIPLIATAQSDVSSASAKGTVTDPQGAAVSNATVTIKDVDQGATRTVTTDSNGEFQIPLVRPGLHDISVEASGFSQYLLKDIQLTVGQTAKFDIKLQVAGVRTEVVVTTSSPLIEIERTQQADTIERRQVENLSNVGRTFASYVYTLPGVSNSNAPRAQLSGRITGFGTSGFSIGGSNGRNNLITVDGGENEYGSGQVRFDITPEAIQEFQVNRNSFTAEFGFTAGTAINIVTKSGTNQFHGSAYLYYRSQHTSARNAFDFTGEKSFEQRVFPGFTVGGPIVRNKLFFFTNYEHQKEDNARFRTYTNSSLLQPSTAQAVLLSQLDASADANVRRISANLRGALDNYRNELSNHVQNAPRERGHVQWYRAVQYVECEGRLPGKQSGLDQWTFYAFAQLYR